MEIDRNVYRFFTRYRRMHMAHQAKDEAREERIHMEIIRRATSPLESGEEVKVVGMASDEECEHDMLVLIRWRRRQLAVPLMQLEGIQVDEETQQAIEDWHYWVNQGYEL
jgi:predicted  nucleic acid-binding Zn ribbon protein